MSSYVYASPCPTLRYFFFFNSTCIPLAYLSIFFHRARSLSLETTCRRIAIFDSWYNNCKSYVISNSLLLFLGRLFLSIHIYWMKYRPLSGRRNVHLYPSTSTYQLPQPMKNNQWYAMPYHTPNNLTTTKKRNDYCIFEVFKMLYMVLNRSPVYGTSIKVPLLLLSF